MSLVLGVESSCDETSAAIVRNGREILSHVILSQDIHEVYGGVVPELASREHVKTIIPVIEEALQEADVTARDLDAVGATSAPGLVGALAVGFSAARSFAWAAGLPLVPVHHLEGHLFSVRLAWPDVPFSFVALIVSGGHTELVEVAREGSYTIVGETRDDAAGEAYDKVAKMAGLPYPGGPHVDRLAASGDGSRYPFRQARLEKGSLDFSFSGIKTAVRYTIRDHPGVLDEEELPHLLAGFQESVVSALRDRARDALRLSGLDRVALVGGVAANRALRAAFEAMAAEEGATLLVPPPVLCTDNAAMIASAAAARLAAGDTIDSESHGVASDRPLPSY
ncbi:MAG: tRNA (adenosine(37)-N6)-threonylcarbamoyltransferase complex transferase subunit TsaD [Gemmatimonadetes bacterium]|nr:tRNA (adenosine(37)-N6)-threonylcarbamoyltransferase complex transferase subunit TsaD [Gemmatimonadota bacterium]